MNIRLICSLCGKPLEEVSSQNLGSDLTMAFVPCSCQSDKMQEKHDKLVKDHNNLVNKIKGLIDEVSKMQGHSERE